jgi:hypothetical protein
MLGTQAVDLHKRCAEWLAMHTPDDDYLLAYHWGKAGNRVKSLKHNRAVSNNVCAV